VPLKFIEPADGLKEMDHLFGTFGKAAAFNMEYFVTAAFAR
jgi:hypothetical protein